MSRRRFGALVIGIGLGCALLRSARSPDEAVTGGNEIDPSLQEITEAVNQFIDIEPGSNRSRAEITFWKGMESRADDLSANQLRHGLSASFSVAGRGYGMEIFWQKRQAGDFVDQGHPPLSQERIAWAEQAGVDKRTLAMAVDAEAAATQLLAARPDIFFEALDNEQRPDNSDEASQHVMNPGGVAMLMQWETGQTSDVGKWGMVNVGTTTAQTQWNQSPQYFPNSDQHLEDTLQRHRNSTGIDYEADSTPGSQKPKTGASSGGAIGPQFMPVWANFFTKAYEEANNSLPEDEQLPDANLWDPYTSLVLVNLYISSEFHARSSSLDSIDTRYTRPGYKKNDPDAARASLRKWNPLKEEVDAVYDAARDFYQLEN